MLHTHSWYSLLEGVSSLDTLLARAAACGYPALALTDTNNLYGAVPFRDAAAKYGVRPRFGACLRQKRNHCVALIAASAGWRSLCRVLTRLHLQQDVGFVDLLAANAEGLHLLVDDLALAQQLREPFGERLWLEVVRPGPGNRPKRHNEQCERELLEGGQRLGLRPIASTAAHFATPEEYETYRLVTSVRQGGLLDQLPARMGITAEHHLVDQATLRERFRDLPEAVSNLTRLAEQLPSDVLPQQTILPPAKTPRQFQHQQYLRLLCDRGLHRRGLYGDPASHERLAVELAIIDAGSLSPYFLVVRDIARHARRQRLTMALRGSAGNSLVCYLLEITDVNPLRFGLALDRFLHYGRPDLPDIDLDFDWRVRDEIIEHVFDRYGHEHTAMVSTHLFLQPRSAFREAGKIHGMSNEQITLLAQSVESVDGGRWTVEEHSLPTASCQLPTISRPPHAFPLEAERWPRFLHDARALFGRPHHLSVHCGGIVITPRPIDEYVPVQRAAKGVRIIQFEKEATEAIGLVKIDLLGNRALANVDETLSRIPSPPTPLPASGRGETEAPTPLPEAGRGDSEQFAICNSQFAICNVFEDDATLQLLQKGDALGVNQLESPAMRHLLTQLKPRGIEDIVCALALIRPGAGAIGMKGRYVQRRCGGEPVPKMPACLEPVLHETFGLLVYQDDALGMIRALTGLSVPDTHRFYKRATKRVPEDEDRRLAEEFRQLCLPRGIPEEVITEQWQLLTHFRRYTFCKSHAVSYALIAWRCAYAKAHFPVHFWTAVLNNNQGVYPRRVYVEAAKRAGLRVLLPCVNRSEETFSPDDGSIRTGLGAIATLPEETWQHILAARQKDGPFRDLADFRRRVEPGPDALATLIRCGALDFTGHNRPALFLEADLQDHSNPSPPVGRGAGVRDRANPSPSAGRGAGVRDRANPSSSAGRGAGVRDRANPSPSAGRGAGVRESLLFDDIGELSWIPSNYEIDRRRRDEWQLLGFVTDVPMLSLFRPRLPKNLVRSIDLPKHRGKRIRTAGLVATGRFAHTERGLEMQFITLEDEWGLMEVTVFPGTCPLLSHLTLGPYVATGVVDEQFGVFTITAESLQNANSESRKHERTKARKEKAE